MPDGGFKRVQDVLSKAELRLQVEELLRRLGSAERSLGGARRWSTRDSRAAAR